MKQVKKGLRLLFIMLLLTLAAFGIGITGSLFGHRERYMDNEIKTEQRDKKEDEGDENEKLPVS